MSERLRPSASIRIGADIVASSRLMSPALMLPSSGSTTWDDTAAPSRERTMSPTLADLSRKRQVARTPSVTLSNPSGPNRRAVNLRGST